MMRLTLLGLCLVLTVTASGLKPDGVVPIEDPGIYPVEDQLVEYIQEPYLTSPYQERPRYDKDIIYYAEEPKFDLGYPEYKKFAEPCAKPEADKSEKSPAIQIYVV